MANTKTTKRASTNKKVADEKTEVAHARRDRLQVDPNEVITVYNGFQGRKRGVQME